MRRIASENYYQKKKWEESRVELEMRRESASLSPEEEEAQHKERHRCLERAFERCEKEQEKTVIKPDPWRQWKFDRAVKLALAAAKHFELNVHIEASDKLGVIKMQGSPILTDAAMWQDDKQKRRLLWPMHLAESVLIDVVDESGEKLVGITLMYNLVRETHRR